MKFNWRSEYYRYNRYFSNLQKKVKEARSFAWLSVSIFTVSFFIIVAIKPTLVTITKLNKEIKDKREISQKLQVKINSIIAAQEEFAGNSDNLYLLSEALPEKSEFPKLAGFFESVALSSGVSVKSLSFESVGKSPPQTLKKDVPILGSMSFSISTSGDYLQLKQFLNTLEASRRIIKIKNASFNQVKKEEVTELSLLVSGQAYFSGDLSVQ